MRVQFRGRVSVENGHIINMMQAARLLRQGCVGLLCYLPDSKSETVTISDIPVIREFPDVFSDDITGLPPNRFVEFTIGLEPGTYPLFIAPYHTSLIETKELKSQLENLLEKGYTMPRASPEVVQYCCS